MWTKMYLVTSLQFCLSTNHLRKNDFFELHRKGAIQIIHDTLGGRGKAMTKCHLNFFCFLKSDLMLFEVKFHL